MNRLPLLFAFAVLGVACSDSADLHEPIGQAQQAITSGSADDADDAIVLLTGPGDGLCTGTLIAPTVVATAAHCLVFPPTAVHVGATRAKGRDIAVATTHLHPDYSGDSFADDVGVVILAADAELVPIALRSEALATADSGRGVRVVGYGATTTTSGTVPGEKQQGSAVISALEETDIKLTGAPSQPCRGDSGGPVLLRDEDGVERLVAVTSRGDAQCASYARAMRMDHYASFFQDAVDAQAPPATPGCALHGRAPASGAPGALAMIVVAALLFLHRNRKAGVSCV